MLDVLFMFRHLPLLQQIIYLQLCREFVLRGIGVFSTSSLMLLYIRGKHVSDLLNFTLRAAAIQLRSQKRGSPRARVECVNARLMSTWQIMMIILNMCMLCE